MKITTAALTLTPETIEEAHHLRDAAQAGLDVLETSDPRRAELKAAGDALHHWNEFSNPVTLSLGAVDHMHTATLMLADWCEESPELELQSSAPLLTELAEKLEGALSLAGELGKLLGRGESKCEGHPAGPFDTMGETKYCDGSCLKSRAA